MDPTAVILRLATATDAPDIRRLIQVVQINPTGLSWKRFLVAVDEQGKLVACGQVKPHNDGSRELASIAVDPAWQHQGIASRIILCLLAENPPPLYLTCRAHLESFYNRFGFYSIPESAMPIYFRRIHRLANSLHRLRIIPEALCVMYVSSPNP